MYTYQFFHSKFIFSYNWFENSKSVFRKFLISYPQYPSKIIVDLQTCIKKLVEKFVRHIGYAIFEIKIFILMIRERPRGVLGEIKIRSWKSVSVCEISVGKSKIVR